MRKLVKTMCKHRPRIFDYWLVQIKRTGTRKHIASWEFSCKKCGANIGLTPKWITAKFVENIILFFSSTYVGRLYMYIFSLLVKQSVYDKFVYRLLFNAILTLLTFLLVDSIFFLLIKFEGVEKIE